MAKYEFNELEAVAHFFKLDPNEMYRSRIAKALKSENYYFVCFINFALTYLVHVKGIKDYLILKKVVFRYLLCVLYISYRGTDKIFASKNMAKLTKTKLSVEGLLEDFNSEEDLWSKIYNSCLYKNEFSEKAHNDSVKITHATSSAFKIISNVLYKQQSYFAGDQPLLNSIKEDRDNIVLFDELICSAINLDYSLYENKKSFSIEYIEEEKWRSYIMNKEHVVADLKILSFVLKEAITQFLTNESDAIKVETPSTYRTIADMKNGSYSNNRFTKYDKERGLIIMDYSVIDEPLRFRFNDVDYVMSKKGIKPIKYNNPLLMHSKD